MREPPTENADFIVRNPAPKTPVRKQNYSGGKNRVSVAETATENPGFIVSKPPRTGHGVKTATTIYISGTDLPLSSSLPRTATAGAQPPVGERSASASERRETGRSRPSPSFREQSERNPRAQARRPSKPNRRRATAPIEVHHGHPYRHPQAALGRAHPHARRAP